MPGKGITERDSAGFLDRKRCDCGMALKLVPPAEPSPKQAVIERVKKMYRPPGVLQCARCGCRTVLTTTQVAAIVDGRYKRGTVIDDRVCAECWRRGIYSPMLPPEIKPV